MKTFLSIGSGPGMGASTAERFAREGYRVVLTSRDTAKLTERAEAMKAKGYAVEIKAADAGDLESVAAVIKETEEQFGTVDVLHYNSASLRASKIEDQDPRTFVSDLAVNIGGALMAVQTVLPGMVERGEGSILLTGGALGVTPHPDYLSLGIGKAGIRNLTLALFDTLKDRGVHIATVTVAAFVDPESREATDVAQAFWNLHNQPRESWTPEVRYES
jgi:short-subunit dehydrogenase